ncbi:MAG TPA: endonuclease/exonuclease/phosphatase family protein [Vicinamibacterales bacterium]|nr:endonuclease/exonuclease/phosphatase family protein [Vicinamibacterales bacterium]
MKSLRILSYNILRGGAGREQPLAAVINQQAPDIVVLQEATRPDVVERLAQATSMITNGAMRGRSLGFMSRVPIQEYHWIRPRWSQHAFLEIVPEGAGMRIFGVHLSAVHAAWTEARRVRELRALLHAIKQHDRTHHVLLGDFNTLAPDERLDVSKLPLRLRALVWLSGGRIRWQTIAIVLGADYVDGYRLLHPGEPGLTFPTWEPHIRLDYVFVPRPFAERLVACDVVTDVPALGQASDHFPVRAELRIS